MSYHVDEPIDPRTAFEVDLRDDSEETQSAAASQAALLLSARAGVVGVGNDAEYWSKESEDSGFELPDLGPLQRTRRLRVDEATQPLGISAKELAQERSPQIRDEVARTVSDLYEKPSTETAAALFEASMRSDHPLVRVAAAAGARETTRLRKQIRQTLEQGCESDDQLVARVAREALSQIDPKDSYLQAAVGERTSQKKRRRESHTSVITHGTWATGGDWYRPGGDFYDGLDNRRPDLELHDQSFQWSGGYSHSARRIGAIDLEQWIPNQGVTDVKFFAHSHGGTVASLATRRGVEFKKLVFMSLPVHTQWFPNPDKVRHIVDIRVRMDLVILADGGGQRFRNSQFDVKEHRHGWFNHFVTHDPAYWDQHDLWDRV